MPKIIAELGSNWNGDLELLESLVSECSRIGVDAVKLQALSEDLLSRHTELAFYRDCSVSESNIEQIDRICKDYSMPWFCTITDKSQIPYIRQYCNWAKIRAADSEKLDLVNSVVSSFDLTFISTLRPQKHNNTKIKMLYCISKYPTEFGEINFAMIREADGYSNHCMNPLAIFRAARIGAKFIEIHITPSREEFAIDNKVSFTPNEMEEIIAWLKQQY